MTRIVLLLTAFPLAAILALLLNTLLERRLAALATQTRPPRRPRGRGIGLALLPVILAVPTAASVPDIAETEESACTSVACSLMVDAEVVDRLWRTRESSGPVVVLQSRIPLDLDDSDETTADEPTGEPVETAGPLTTAL